MTSTRHRRRSALALVFIVVASTASCGSDVQGSEPETSAAAPTATATPLPEETPVPTPPTPPTPTPTPTAEPTPTPSPTPPATDLEAVDWRNHAYLLPPCAETPNQPPVEVMLVDGKAEPSADNGGFFYDLVEVVYGSMGEPTQPVASVMLAKTGASGFPPLVLVYDGSGTQEALLGAAAGILDETRGDCSLLPADPNANLWEVETMQVSDDGLLILTGVGFADAPMCCPDLSVVSTVALGDDGMLVELEHTEVPL